MAVVVAVLVVVVLVVVVLVAVAVAVVVAVAVAAVVVVVVLVLVVAVLALVLVLVELLLMGVLVVVLVVHLAVLQWQWCQHWQRLCCCSRPVIGFVMGFPSSRKKKIVTDDREQCQQPQSLYPIRLNPQLIKTLGPTFPRVAVHRFVFSQNLPNSNINLASPALAGACYRGPHPKLYHNPGYPSQTSIPQLISFNPTC